MHFTREPIIESILSARDGFKLVLKNSKNSGGAEISAEVVEIVSFSGAVFYRSQDRSKNFLLPASDYEINEVKDARLVLKNISLEKSNKLQNPQKEASSHEYTSEDATAGFAAAEEGEPNLTQAASTSQVPASHSSRQERRRERRRNRRRRQNEERTQEEKKDTQDGMNEASDQESQVSEQLQPIPVPTLNLIPPPPTLISQTLARYKEKPHEPSNEPLENTSVVVEDATTQSSYQAPLEPEDLV